MSKYKTITLLGAYDQDLARFQHRVGKDRSERSLRAMQQGRQYVAAFLIDWMHVPDIHLSQLTPQFINDFSIYLSTDRGLRGGTIWLACQLLKGVVTRAHVRGLLKWNPFGQFHIAKNIRPREYLTEEEIAMLMTHDFKKSTLNFARDIFIFAAFTGLAFIDVKELRASDVVTVNGGTWIISRRHKTRTPFQVKLLNIPLEIIKRYHQDGQTIFPPMEYRTMAKRILRIMNECGFSKHITMHCARHSFAVLALNKGVPIESVSRILGHTNITTTQIYAKITMRKLDSDLTAFEKSLHLINNI
jgi:integrase